MTDQPARDPVLHLLNNTGRETQELVAALCEVSADRVRDLVYRDLREQASRVIEERFAQLDRAMGPRLAEARLEIARGLGQVLKDCFVRMRRFESDRDWCEAMLDAAWTMSRRCAFFSVRGADLCLQDVRGIDAGAQIPPVELPYVTARAFNQVITTGETLSVQRRAEELSARITEMFGGESDGRALLTPLTTDGRVPGILYTEDAVDASAIEAIAAVGAAVLEKHLPLSEPVHTSIDPVRTVSVEPPAPAPDPSELRALRFARVEIARLLLEHGAAISEGRRSRRLYASLQSEIDALRASYRNQFDGVCDHLHTEIVRTLALHDATLLGAHYPGPLA